ncbi:MAG: hypothetical protein ACHP84_06845 [Caulobacterales bacterium]
MPTEAEPDREKLASGEIQFALHSRDPDDSEDRRVDAGVFAAKLGALVGALKAADASVNGGSPAHSYVIERLLTSTPTARLKERPLRRDLMIQSGIDAFDRCAQAITVGERDTALTYGKCVTKVETLARGAEKTFGYGEIQTPANVVRIDQFLAERTKSVISPERPIARTAAAGEWFKGATQGSFVGMVRVVDLRGKLPAIKLILSAGSMTLDCACIGLTVDQIRHALNRRVRVFGRAIYDGKGGLPRRVEIRDIEVMETDGDISNWRGAFEPFEVSTWDETEN